MRIVQLIDSLEVGGAEKMAVNYANALQQQLGFCAFVTTRKEGPLKAQLHSTVIYKSLQRKSTFDFRALMAMRTFCKSYQITHLHAHGSSYFFAFMIQILIPSLTVIWHDHNGLRAKMKGNAKRILQFCSMFFHGIIVVNYQLKQWAETELRCKRVLYLPNFTLLDSNVISNTKLAGEEGKRIVHLANLRYPKNHFLLVEVAEQLKVSHPDWTFHLIGHEFQDAYSLKLRQIIAEKGLQNHIFIYGSQNDIYPILAQATIAVLTSESEGLPVAVLEYGLAQLPFISTAVGEIPLILQEGKNGMLVPNYDSSQFYHKLAHLITNPELQQKLGKGLSQTILHNHSEQAVIQQFVSWLNAK